ANPVTFMDDDTALSIIVTALNLDLASPTRQIDPGSVLALNDHSLTSRGTNTANVAPVFAAVACATLDPVVIERVSQKPGHLRLEQRASLFCARPIPGHFASCSLSARQRDATEPHAPARDQPGPRSPCP